MKVLISEDDAIAGETLASILLNIQGIDATFLCASSEDVIAALNQHQPDMAFIDVNTLSSWRLDAFSRSSAGIAVLANDESHAFHAFESHAIDYLVRPYSAARVQASVHKLCKLRGTTLANVALNVGGNSPGAEQLISTGRRRKTVVRPTEVLYAVARKNYVELFTHDENHLVRRTFSSALSLLGEDQFVIANRSVAVRRTAVRGIECFASGQYWISLINGARIRTSRKHRKTLRHIFRG